ncbi:MAG: hypothetical protein MZV63_46145 [Marinilabiliales bacterium]|nr:hypothetical protein [Marinilabiliales bacterium]
MACFTGGRNVTSCPLIDFSVFADNRTFVFSNIAAMINYGATFGVGVLLSLYLQYIQGFSAATARAHPCCPAGGPDGLLAVAGPALGPHRARIVATAGMALTTLGPCPLHLPDPFYPGMGDRCKPHGAPGSGTAFSHRPIPTPS